MDKLMVVGKYTLPTWMDGCGSTVYIHDPYLGRHWSDKQNNMSGGTNLAQQYPDLGHSRTR